jgi:hypothetical protein
MSTDAVVLNLKSLKLFGMADAVKELAEQGAPAYHQSTGLSDQLIKAEVADREVRSINRKKEQKSSKITQNKAIIRLSGWGTIDANPGAV